MIKKIFFGLLLLITVLAVIIMFQRVDPTQQNLVEQAHDFPRYLSSSSFDLDSLKQVVGDDKGLPQGFELPALIAYSAYPELDSVNVKMILTQSGAPMEASFNIWTLFGSRSERAYEVLLNNAQNTGFDEILLRSLPLDAQVGILAHELGHVVYYHQLTTLQIAKWGIMYLVSSDFRARHERSTDLMPVYRGLASQIYQYAYYVRHDPSCRLLFEQFGAEFANKYYMSDEELSEYLED